jgi:oligogalacturonide lyase
VIERWAIEPSHDRSIARSHDRSIARSLDDSVAFMPTLLLALFGAVSVLVALALPPAARARALRAHGQLAPDRMMRVLALLSTAGLVFASSGGRPMAGGFTRQADAPREWVDPSTGHRVVRLSDQPGLASLYFHQNPYTAAGDKMVVSSPEGLWTIDLATRASRPLVKGRASHLVVGRRSRKAFYIQGDTVYETSLDTGETRKILQHPRIRTGSGFGISADERHLAGSFVTQAGPESTRSSAAAAPGAGPPAAPGALNPQATPPPTASGLEARWAARLPMAIYTLEIATGTLKIVYESNDWLNHVQMSPTDPSLILYCHEGPWHKVDRVWTIRTDGSRRRLMHERTMEMEIAGHEFFGADGRTVWYDLQTPKSKVFWLAGVEVESGRRTRYPVARAEWSVHFNISPDGKLFAGDGGGPNSVAAPGNGQWIYLFTPTPDGTLMATRLVDLSKHDYRLEPNVTFTPDQTWIVFRSNMHGATHTYAVEVARRSHQE